MAKKDDRKKWGYEADATPAQKRAMERSIRDADVFRRELQTGSKQGTPKYNKRSSFDDFVKSEKAQGRRVGIDSAADYSKRYDKELSGGENRRMARQAALAKAMKKKGK
jgi:ABC-type dipeptide/oligopeptide/nickel transport system ATPase subunit